MWNLSPNRILKLSNLILHFQYRIISSLQLLSQLLDNLSFVENVWTRFWNTWGTRAVWLTERLMGELKAVWRRWPHHAILFVKLGRGNSHKGKTRFRLGHDLIIAWLFEIYYIPGPCFITTEARKISLAKRAFNLSITLNLSSLNIVSIVEKNQLYSHCHIYTELHFFLLYWNRGIMLRKADDFNCMIIHFKNWKRTWIISWLSHTHYIWKKKRHEDISYIHIYE